VLRNWVRAICGSGVLIVLLAGFVGGPHVGEVAAANPTPAEMAYLREISAGLKDELPPPTYTYSRRVFTRISLNPDDQNILGPLIEVDIATQRLTAWVSGKIVYRFAISTARPGYHTPRGHFHILDKASNWWSNQWSVWMPDALHFYGDYFIHALPYRSDPSQRIGGSMLGIADSHGCVRVGVADQQKLFDWAHVGIPVWVHD
jgi:lipoprotein-anchoring transpeptidase ErfK/SrfK